MILSGPEIASIVERCRASRKFLTESWVNPKDSDIPLPLIDITPWQPDTHLGPNSYDVTLGPKLLIYDLPQMNLGVDYRTYLDIDQDTPTISMDITGGLILQPGVLYLGSTVEKTKTAGVVPWLDGRSSIGRLGLSVHVTAGRGDDGFGCGTPEGNSWTLEITVTHPVRIRSGIRIGQLSFFLLRGNRLPYKGRYAEQGADPVASRMWMNKSSPMEG